MNIPAPPVANRSRFAFCEVQIDDSNRLFIDARKPYRYKAFPDNIAHVVREGETLFNLAGYYYQVAERGAGLWWVIADFQPIPILDPTIRLAPGQMLIIPTLRRVTTEILSTQRRGESRL